VARRSNGGLEGLAHEVYDGPLWLAPLAAAMVYAIFAYLPGLVSGGTAAQFLVGAAPWLAGAVLIAGLLGTVNRWVDRVARRRRTGAVPQKSSAAVAVPDCPRCGGPMQQRLARKGASAGEHFWGCTAYPKCKGTRPISPSQ
jgi:hypothetical protein